MGQPQLQAMDAPVEEEGQAIDVEASINEA